MEISVSTSKLIDDFQCTLRRKFDPEWNKINVKLIDQGVKCGAYIGFSRGRVVMKMMETSEVVEVKDEKMRKSDIDGTDLPKPTRSAIPLELTL
ncbi:MAG: hypothetical protein EU536_01060 [Promethearchaeota archaeon]|nr:MAG: hypothetical protein EU536_01060 [Candidatus Lokiarchaeota archaeon]